MYPNNKNTTKKQKANREKTDLKYIGDTNHKSILDELDTNTLYSYSAAVLLCCCCLGRYLYSTYTNENKITIQE